MGEFRRDLGEFRRKVVESLEKWAHAQICFFLLPMAPLERNHELARVPICSADCHKGLQSPPPLSKPSHTDRWCVEQQKIGEGRVWKTCGSTHSIFLSYFLFLLPAPSHHPPDPSPVRATRPRIGQRTPMCFLLLGGIQDRKSRQKTF